MWCRLVTGGKAEDVKALTWLQSNEVGALACEQAPEDLYEDPGRKEHSSTLQSPQTEQRLADAFQKGFREGEAASSQKMADRMETKMTNLAQAIEQLASHRSNIQRQAEPELVRLSLTIARRILRRELTVDPDSLLGLVKAGLEKIESSEIHRVRVHPEHAATLGRLLAGSARAVAIVADTGLPVGAVVFETTRGSFDAGLETQLKEIERGFADIYPR